MNKFDLREKTNKLEDGIITLSGPALAISGIIAGVDLLTGGTWMQQWPWLTFAWAVCLLLTLDFQVLSLGARVHHIYLDSKKGGWRKAGEIILAVLIAASISYVSIQMQSIIARANSTTGLSIAEATAQLGINPLALIWERSALVLVLIFLSGWFREEVKHLPVSSVSSETPTSISEETVQVILAKLAKLDQLEQAFTQQKVTVIPESETPLALPETVETSGVSPFKLGMIEQGMYDAIMDNPRDADELLKLSESMSLGEFTDVLKQRYSQYEKYITPQRVSNVLAYARSETGETAVEQSDLTAQIEKLLNISPDISTREVAAIVGKPHSTVYRQMKQLKQQ